MASLETVPLEVLLGVARHLDFESVLALSTLNRALHAFVQPLAVASDPAKRDFFLKVERFPQHSSRAANRLTCFTCWRLLPRDAFGDGEATGPRGKWAAEHHRDRFAARRFCWTCAAARRLYPDNQAVRKGAHLWYLCHGCGVFKLRSQRCERHRLREDGGRRPYDLRVCTALPDPAPASPLEKLPAALQRRVFAQLPYRDAVMLAQASRRLQGAVDPLAAPLASKVDFVRARLAVSARPGHACYGCFRVRDCERFTAAEHRRARGDWRAQVWAACRSCAVRRCDAATPEGRAALAEWRQRRTCWKCRGVVACGDFVEDEKCCQACAKQDGVATARREVREGRRRAAEAAGTQGDEALESVSPWMEQMEDEYQHVEAERQARAEAARKSVPAERPQEDEARAETVLEIFGLWMDWDAKCKRAEVAGSAEALVDIELVSVGSRVGGPEEAAKEPQALEVLAQERHQERFRSGQMSVAERSLYRRIQNMVRSRREREQGWRRVHGFMAESARRLRGLVLGTSA